MSHSTPKDFDSHYDFKRIVQQNQIPFWNTQNNKWDWRPIDPEQKETIVGSIGTEQTWCPCVYVKVYLLRNGEPILYYESNSRSSCDVDIAAKNPATGVWDTFASFHNDHKCPPEPEYTLDFHTPPSEMPTKLTIEDDAHMLTE